MSGKKIPDRGGPEGHEDFLVLFRRGLQFTEELLAENEKLRFRIAALESEVDGVKRGVPTAGGDEVVTELRKKVLELEQEKLRLLSSYQEVETLNRDYQTRYAEIEEEHNNLANLYISSFQLHATNSFRDVVQVIHEIVINLVGAERFTMYLLDHPTRKLHAIAGEGHDIDKVAPIALGEGVIGKALESRQKVLAQKGQSPVAVIPLATQEQLVGVIAIEALLVQKDALTAVDQELFNLLSVHAATALLSGLLRDQVGKNDAPALTIEHARRLL